MIYPSVVPPLPEASRAGTLRIVPRTVATGAETLSDRNRALVEETWGRKPFNQYGSTEAGNFAAECDRHRGLHIFEDEVIIEIVDDKNRPVPAGTLGDKVLLTVLSSRTLPLIRYELRDRVRKATTMCSCGLPFGMIDRIEGRSDDILRFASESGGTVAVHPIVFARVLETVDAAGWSIVRHPDVLKVLLSGTREECAGQAVAASLRDELQNRGIEVPEILVETVSSLPRGITGKASVIVNCETPYTKREADA